MTSSSAPQVQGFCSECAAPLSWALGTPLVRCEYCGSGVAIDGQSQAVRLACPSCGGDLYAVDGAMAARCPYCAAALLALTRKRLLRYVVSAPFDVGPPVAGATLYFLPFWHLTGVVMGWDVGKQTRKALDRGGYVDDGGADGEVLPTTSSVEVGPAKVFQGRVVQTWIADPATRAWGITSLGSRAAVFPVEPFDPSRHERMGAVVPTSISCAEAEENLVAQGLGLGYAADGLRLECQRRDLVGESFSLLYYPFWARRDQSGEMTLWDAVTREAEPVGARGEAPSARASEVFDELEVIELRCGRCGGQLEPGPRPVVLPCRACHTFWVAGRHGLEPFEARYAAVQLELDQGEPIWLPYWQVRVDVQYCGRPAATVGQMRKVLGIRPPRLPGDVGAADSESPLHYYVPAFGALRAPRIDVAGRDLTRAQPRLDAVDPVDGAVVSCFYAPEDAERLSYVVWLQILAGAVPRRLRSLRIRTGEVALWYLPFAATQRELRSLVSGMRYDRAVFRGVNA